MASQPRTNNSNASDHDLLIRIDTRLEILSASVSQNHNDVTMRLNELDKDKVSYKELDVLRETINGQQLIAERLAEKVDWTRSMLWKGMGILAALNIIIPIVLALALRK